MKRLLSIITMIALALMCQRVSVHAQETGKSMAVQFLEANDGLKGAKCMKLDGLMLSPSTCSRSKKTGRLRRRRL